MQTWREIFDRKWKLSVVCLRTRGHNVSVRNHRKSFKITELAHTVYTCVCKRDTFFTVTGQMNRFSEFCYRQIRKYDLEYFYNLKIVLYSLRNNLCINRCDFYFSVSAQGLLHYLVKPENLKCYRLQRHLTREIPYFMSLYSRASRIPTCSLQLYLVKAVTP